MRLNRRFRAGRQHFRSCSPHTYCIIAIVIFSFDFAEQLTCHGSQGVEPIPPHLSHSINATEINVELIDVNATVRAMRVGAEIALVANESVPNAFNVAERKLIDDGRAPGEFRMVDVLSPGAMNNSKGASD